MARHQGSEDDIENRCYLGSRDPIQELGRYPEDVFIINSTSALF